MSSGTDQRPLSAREPEANRLLSRHKGGKPSDRLTSGAAEKVLFPLSTQIVGSYSKPNWLLRKDRTFRFGDEPWRPEPDVRKEAREDAARLAIYEQERAGLDVVTDGEAQRAAYDRYFYTRLGGIDTRHLTVKGNGSSSFDEFRQIREDRATELVWARSNVPRIVAPLSWPGPLSVSELQFLKQHATKPVKATVVGPVTAYHKLHDDFYGDPRQAILALARVINQELRALDQEGVDLLQLDEPVLHTNAALALRFGEEALEVVTEGLHAPIAVHVCYGYAYHATSKRPSEMYADILSLLASSDRVAAISLEYEQPGHGPEILRSCGDKHVLLGLLNLGTETVETVDHIADRIEAALEVVPIEQLHPSSDCGMWHLPRDVAFGKIRALATAARRIRDPIVRGAN